MFKNVGCFRFSKTIRLNEIKMDGQTIREKKTLIEIKINFQQFNSFERYILDTITRTL